MAIKVEKRVVCDINDRHTGNIRQWRVTIDGQTKVFDLCPRCAQPFQKMWDLDGHPPRGPQRMKIKTLSQIEGEKQKTPTARKG
jgi:hypothetical protein